MTGVLREAFGEKREDVEAPGENGDWGIEEVDCERSWRVSERQRRSRRRSKKTRVRREVGEGVEQLRR